MKEIYKKERKPICIQIKKKKQADIWEYMSQAMWTLFMTFKNVTFIKLNSKACTFVVYDFFKKGFILENFQEWQSNFLLYSTLTRNILGMKRTYPQTHPWLSWCRIFSLLVTIMSKFPKRFCFHDAAMFSFIPEFPSPLRYAF